MVLDDPIDGDWFEAYVDQLLVPDLRRGKNVNMDHLSSHKRASIRDLIGAAGAHLIFLRPYSPDFNPIEKASARLKAMPAKPERGPSLACGLSPTGSSTYSGRRNAPTISAPAAMPQIEWEPLYKASPSG